MKKLLFMAVICLLASAGHVNADNYFTLLAKNAEVINDTTIRITPSNVESDYYLQMYVAAHFDGYLDHWYLEMTHPDSMFIAVDNIIQEGPGMTVPYVNSLGNDDELQVPLLTKVVNTSVQNDTTKLLSYFSSTITAYGFWDPDEDGDYEPYGTVKWGPCELDTMFSTKVTIPYGRDRADFTLDATMTSTSDARPTVTTVYVPHAVKNIHILIKYRKGDVNGDGQVNLTDVSQLVDWLGNGFVGATDYQIAACDVNEDGQTNLTDVTYLIDILLGQQGLETNQLVDIIQDLYNQ